MGSKSGTAERARGTKSVGSSVPNSGTRRSRWWSWARPSAEVARETQANEGTLGTWVSRYRQEHAGEEPPLNIGERARLRELERENREPRMKAEFLAKAAAFFAQEYR